MKNTIKIAGTMLSVVLLTLLIVFIGSSLKGCDGSFDSPKTEKQIIIDSVRISILIEKNIEIDSIKKEFSLKAEKAEQKADYNYKTAKTYRELSFNLQNRLNAMALQDFPCDSQLNVSKHLNKSLKNEVLQLDSACVEYKITIENKNEELILSKWQLDNDSIIIKNYQNINAISDSIIVSERENVEKQIRKTKFAKFIGNVKTAIFTTAAIAGTIYVLK